ERTVGSAHGVILIGGVGGTGEVGKHALKAHVPVYPLAYTGGDSERVHAEILGSWEQFGWMPMSREEFLTLRNEEPPLDLIGESLRRTRPIAEPRPETPQPDVQAKSTDPGQVKMLFMAATPKDLPSLQIDREFDAISGTLQSSDIGRKTRLHFQKAARRSD